MRRSHRFPYTARSSARKICHAVSIDERRAKFRQDLITEKKEHHEGHRRPHLGYFRYLKYAQNVTDSANRKASSKDDIAAGSSRKETLAAPDFNIYGNRERFRSISRGRSRPRSGQTQVQDGDGRASFLSCRVSDFSV